MNFKNCAQVTKSPHCQELPELFALPFRNLAEVSNLRFSFIELRCEYTQTHQ